MKMECTTKEDVLVLTPREARIDADLAPEFKAEMLNLVKKGHFNIVVNFSAVDFIDSSGLGALVSAFKEIGDRGQIKLCELRDGLTSIFSLTRLDSIFSIHQSETEAITSIHS